jgi:hypothetical protein
MFRKSFLLVIAASVPFLGGCSVYYAITAQPAKNLEALDVQADRAVIEAVFRCQIVREESVGETKRVIYKFEDGLPLWSNLLRGVAWGACDFFTLCLSELVTWPLEITVFAPEEMHLEVVYDAHGRVREGKIINSRGTLVRGVPTQAEPAAGELAARRAMDR